MYNSRTAMSPPVRTAVIPAAGLGTRFLPVTKAIPKEMIPLLDRPMIQFIVQEAVDAGIDHVVMVISNDKEAVRDYFTSAPDLEQALRDRGKTAEATTLQRLANLARFSFVIQEEQLGLGHAVLCAKEAVGRQPFAVLLPDDLILGAEPALVQMLRARQRWQGNYLAVEEVPTERISSYGVIKGTPVAEGVYHVEGMVEKPPAEQAPSNLGIVGRYILEPEVFDALERTRPGAINEIQLTDGIAQLLQSQPVYAYHFEGTRYDCGDPLGLLHASLAMALGRPDTAPQVREWLRELEG